MNSTLTLPHTKVAETAPSVPNYLASDPMPRFDPDQHIIYQDRPITFPMERFGFANDVGISPVAATLPFPLFSSEAIQIMRSEIDKPEVRAGYHFSSDIANSQLRGYAREHAPFTYAAWNHPVTGAIVSKLAGIDLIPWSDYEIAHVNLSAPSNHDMSLPEKDVPIVGWHTDAYPFVCILMLSDCTSMMGGETCLRTANGDNLLIPGPAEGYATILQGRYIIHQALRAVGTKDRITSVTSWRPRSAFVKDDSTLRTVRPVSDLNELYPDFAQYRLDIIKQRIEKMQIAIHSRRQVGTKFDTPGFKAFLDDLVHILVRTNDELVVGEGFNKGFVATVNIPDIVISEPCEPAM